MKISSKIANSGVHKKNSTEINKLIEISNIFNLLFILPVLPFIFFARTIPSALTLTFLPILLHLISFLIVNIGYHKLGRFIFAITTATSVYFVGAFSLITEATDGMAVKFLILGTILLPFVIFTKKEWKLTIATLAIDLFYISTFNFANKHINLGDVNINLDTPMLRNISILTAFSMFVSTFFYYKKIITQNNKQLEYANNKYIAINRSLHDKKKIIEKQNTALENTLTLVEQQQNEMLEYNQNMAASISYAKTIQDALLTRTEFINSIFSEHFILFQPKEMVSGDFYYAQRIEKYIIFAVADCTGHGVPGGFLTMLGITNLHSSVKKFGTKDTGKTLNLLRTKIKNVFSEFSNRDQDALDIALCSINTKTHIMKYSGAYNPLVVIRNNQLIEYKATRNPIGFYPTEQPFKTHKIKLENNDRIYIYTDGFQDQIGGERLKKFSSKKFKELLTHIHKLPLAEQANVLKKVNKEWRAKFEQVDDITIMGIKYRI